MVKGSSYGCAFKGDHNHMKNNIIINLYRNYAI
jgi:hypothetical protein